MHPESIAAANPPNPMPDPVETPAPLGRLTVSFAGGRLRLRQPRTSQGNFAKALLLRAC
jgi:hypothetical protein